MSVDLTTIIISISAAFLSGFGARLFSSFAEKKGSRLGVKKDIRINLN